MNIFDKKNVILKPVNYFWGKIFFFTLLNQLLIKPFKLEGINYPAKIVAKEIEKFIKKKQDTIFEAVGPKLVSEVNFYKNKTRFFVLPYVSKKADKIVYG